MAGFLYVTVFRLERLFQSKLSFLGAYLCRSMLELGTSDSLGVMLGAARRSVDDEPYIRNEVAKVGQNVTK